VSKKCEIECLIKIITHRWRTICWRPVCIAVNKHYAVVYRTDDSRADDSCTRRFRDRRFPDA